MPVSIPWTYNENPLIKVWLWKTPHFESRIFAEGLHRKNYSWKITDKSRGRDIPFDSGTAESFQEAVKAVTEVIGKSYPPKLGYQVYAGSAATTFEIGDGTAFDFGPLNGKNVLIRYVDDDNAERLASGSIQIDRHTVMVRQDNNSALTLPPNRIIDVQEEYSGISLVNEEKTKVHTRASKAKRVFYEEYRKGCTGKPGLYAGTTIHGPNDEFCPIHNI